jgi:hypothetical protein
MTMGEAIRNLSAPTQRSLTFVQDDNLAEDRNCPEGVMSSLATLYSRRFPAVFVFFHGYLCADAIRDDY